MIGFSLCLASPLRFMRQNLHCCRVKHVMVTTSLLVCGAMTTSWICDKITDSGFGIYLLLLAFAEHLPFLFVDSCYFLRISWLFSLILALSNSKNFILTFLYYLYYISFYNISITLCKWTSLIRKFENALKLLQFTPTQTLN